MKNFKSNNNKKIIAPVLAIVLLLVIAFFSIRALSNLNLGNGHDEKNVSENKDDTNTLDSDKEIKSLPEENKKTEKVTSEQETTGCTWKTIEREIPTYILDEETTTVTQKNIVNYSYEYKISDDSERTIKKTLDGKSYDAFTSYNKDRFKNFYDNFQLKGWFIDTGISKYDSVDSDSAFKIENTGNMTGEYTILRIYTTEKDNRYFDEKATSIKIEIKAGDVKTITFDASIICYVIGNSNASDKNHQIILMKDFMKRRQYGISQEDFIIFPSNDKNIACARPYFIVIPDTYQKEYTSSEEVVRQYYRTATKSVKEIVCE